MDHSINQMMEIDAMETKLTQPKMSHYKYVKQKVKSTKAKDANKTLQDGQVKWDKEEDTKEKLTTPTSVPENYKKYTIEE